MSVTMTAAMPALCSTLLLTILRVAGAQSLPSFSSFVQSYKRSYSANSAEYEKRRTLYEKRVADAEQQNKKLNKLWTAGVNEFWDWNPSEMSSLFGWSGAARPESSFGGSRMASIRKADFLQKGNRTLPEAKTWSHLQTMQSVKSQGGCGSCWAIAAVSTLEAATEIHSTQRRTFSAQELVSCVPNPQECGGQGGCRGATVELAVDWVMKYGNFEEYQAPYVGTDMPCQTTAEEALKLHENKNGAAFGMHGWETLPKNKYEPLVRALAETGPTAVSVDATPWHMYEKGIFDGCMKDAIINHAVVSIGYGVENGVKFWEIQNSWGAHWGEKGRIRMLRRDDDEQQCGIDNKPELGTGCKGGPSQVTVCGMCGVLYDSVIVHIA